jgi:hypothetical protein
MSMSNSSDGVIHRLFGWLEPLPIRNQMSDDETCAIEVILIEVGMAFENDLIVKNIIPRLYAKFAKGQYGVL